MKKMDVSSRLFVLVCVYCIFSVFAAMPDPFYRELSVTSPLLTGNDVLTVQTLVKRDKAVDPSLLVNSIYDEATAAAVTSFQASNGLKSTGIFDEITAQLLLDLHTDDGYQDSGFTAESMGYLYKFHIPVYKNRSIETFASLFDAKGNLLLKFRVRSHGYRDDGTEGDWPDFGVGDVGQTQFADNGNTVTGLIEMDLNSPEPYANVYGPWPVNRFVRGLDGNAALALPTLRDGLLIHTGNWTTDTQRWNPTMPMPNSAGCVHGLPRDVERIYELLVGLGVKVNDNPFSGRNYPYQPQGIAVVELIE
jgi:peptidoglycan hydrolase-like protein with peptidoglycan-binding domain